MAKTALRQFWTAWNSDNPNWLRLQATADSEDAPFSKQYLEAQRKILGEQDFKQEYLGIPGGGLASRSPGICTIVRRITIYR